MGSREFSFPDLNCIYYFVFWNSWILKSMEKYFLEEDVFILIEEMSVIAWKYLTILVKIFGTKFQILTHLKAMDIFVYYSLQYFNLLSTM